MTCDDVEEFRVDSEIYGGDHSIDATTTSFDGILAVPKRIDASSYLQCSCGSGSEQATDPCGKATCVMPHLLMYSLKENSVFEGPEPLKGVKSVSYKEENKPANSKAAVSSRTTSTVLTSAYIQDLLNKW